MKVEAEETLRSLREVNSSLQLKQLRQQASWKQSRAIKTCLYYITFTCYATRVQKAKQRGLLILSYSITLATRRAYKTPLLRSLLPVCSAQLSPVSKA